MFKCKKSKNPGAIDSYLESQGLYRKNVAYDETCLFRAVSEQLFNCQIYHERVRKHCIDYGQKYPYKFSNIFDDEEDWYQHLDLLENHMVVCGNIEIQLISEVYRRDVLVFDSKRLEFDSATGGFYDEKLMLCLMSDDHYDVIYEKEHIQKAGFCQSIVYGILYENVFQVHDVQNIVHGMLSGKEFASASSPEVNNNLDEQLVDDKRDFKVPFLKLAPFPFKVAKALDPNIYRNIEYDSWTEVRRELRLGDWYYGDDNLILGTKCIYNDLFGDQYECYIQQIFKRESKCLVYIVKLAEKRTVNYIDLSPENDAKPWPLPYRFSKAVTPVVKTEFPNIKLRPPKKRREIRKSKSNSESSAHSNFRENCPDADIKSFVGAPLQMQNRHNNHSDHHQNYGKSCPQPQQMSVSQHNLLVTPDVASPKFTWEGGPWEAYPSTPDQVVWSPAPGTSQSVYNFNMKPMVASAPVTPNIVPYHDNQFPFLYNYHVDNYNTFNQWMGPNEIETEEVQIKEEQSEYINYDEVQPPQYSIAFPPGSPQVEMYTPVMQVPPGTPVIYAPAQEVILPTTPVPLFTPPIEMQYVSPGPTPYVYSATTPPAWYPPGINTQGFIFPTPVNSNVPK